ncbi:hypothetical protein OOZ54_02625 [Rhodopseudomonas palustris]|uniref:hypothetical protein n=1 Tax=Rhodopseudomonas palustris TaxID=1076 RepID=UPI0022EFEAA5|nr:hypothetical protein [Rhodopseudomonas palustris]WBU30413.1 hypothetical protein OOZ54_02625 [Rhodopseudomonas palustris]
MSIIGFPLLLIPVAICNIIVFLMPGLAFDAALTRVVLPSGATWTIALGDTLVALGVLLLLPEVMKAARPGAKYLTDHLLSLLVLGGITAEFVMLPQFANATVALLSLLALVDFLSGIALRSRHRREARAARSAAAKSSAETIEDEPEPVAEPAPVVPTIDLAPQTVEPTSASAASAASIAEAVLLDRPEPVKPTETAKNEEKSPAR